jgi:endonuclease YncB( thermonuclease family)
MVGRVQTDDPVKGIQDVGIELIRAGLAQRIPKQDYRYRKLSEAEAEAQRAKRGIWADTQPG